MDSLIVFTAKYLFLLVAGVAFVFGILTPTAIRKRFFLWAILAGVVAFVITKLAGLAYFDPRPFTHGVHALMSHDPDNGFPSDHTVLSMVAALVLFPFNRIAGAVLILGAILVGASRVAAGIHSPLDIIAGIVIAVIAVASTWHLSALIDRKLQKRSASQEVAP